MEVFIISCTFDNGYDYDDHYSFDSNIGVFSTQEKCYDRFLKLESIIEDIEHSLLVAQCRSDCIPIIDVAVSKYKNTLPSVILENLSMLPRGTIKFGIEEYDMDE